MTQSTGPIGLNGDLCRTRQARLCRRLRDDGLDAAVLTDLRHVNYLGAHWQRQITAAGMLVTAEGSATMLLGDEPEDDVAADEVVVYESNRLATLVDDQFGAMFEALRPRLDGISRLGCDNVARPWLLPDLEVVDVAPMMMAMRRKKDPDEVAMLRRGIAGCEAAYAAARSMLKPGVPEVELFATMQAAAVNAVGEPIGEFGNDFQSGGGGGKPRLRPVEAGETIPLDISVVVRGYSSDLCRTFAVDGSPSAAQREAHKLVVEALDHVAQNVRPGVRCAAIYDEVFKMIDGRNGWHFTHHLGHGIGLHCHEAPRLNPNWDDTFAVGDVFTAEPGLYADELRGGSRVEDNFLVTETGVERLSHYSTDL